jgi:putative transposase
MITTVFSPDIIQHTDWLYHRFSLSFHDIGELIAEHDVLALNQTVRYGQCGETWHVDEIFDRIPGKQNHLYRAVDQD